MKGIKTYLLGIAAVFSCCTVLTSETYGAETVLYVGVDPHLPPYQFIQDGEYQGVHIDLLNAIAEEEDLIIEYISFENMTDCMEALDEGKVDIVLGGNYKPGRRALAIWDGNIVVVVRLYDCAQKQGGRIPGWTKNDPN